MQDKRQRGDARERHDDGTPPRPGADDRAAGTIDRPVPPGEAQAGDLTEQAQQLGGPVDVFPHPGRRRRERPDG